MRTRRAYPCREKSPYQENENSCNSADDRRPIGLVHRFAHFLSGILSKTSVAHRWRHKLRWTTRIAAHSNHATLSPANYEGRRNCKMLWLKGLGTMNVRLRNHRGSSRVSCLTKSSRICPVPPCKHDDGRGRQHSQAVKASAPIDPRSCRLALSVLASICKKRI